MSRIEVTIGFLAVLLGGCGSGVDTATTATPVSEPNATTAQQREAPSANGQAKPETPPYKVEKNEEDGSTVVSFLVTKAIPEARVRKAANGDEETYTVNVEVVEEKTCTVPAGEDIDEAVRRAYEKFKTPKN